MGGSIGYSIVIIFTLSLGSLVLNLFKAPIIKYSIIKNIIKIGIAIVIFIYY